MNQGTNLNNGNGNGNNLNYGPTPTPGPSSDNRISIDVSMNPHTASYLFNAINEFTPGTLMRAGDIYSSFKANIQAGFANSPVEVSYGVSSPDQDTGLAPALPIPTKVHRSTMTFKVDPQYLKINPLDLDMGVMSTDVIKNCDEIAKGYINILVTSKVYNEAVEQSSMANNLRKAMPWIEEWIRRRPEETFVQYAKDKQDVYKAQSSDGGKDLYLPDVEVNKARLRGATTAPGFVKIGDIASIPNWQERPSVETMIAGFNTAAVRQINYRSFASSIMGTDVEMDKFGELCNVQPDGSLTPKRLKPDSSAKAINDSINAIISNPDKVSLKECIGLLILLKTEKAFGGDMFAIQAGSPLVARARVLAYKRILGAQEDKGFSKLDLDDQRGLLQLGFPRTTIPWFMKNKVALAIGVVATAALAYGVISFLGATGTFGLGLNSLFTSLGVSLGTGNAIFAAVVGLPVVGYGLRKTFQWARECYKRKLFENMQAVQVIGDPFLMMATTEKLIEDKLYKKKLVSRDQEVRVKERGKEKGIRDYLYSKEWVTVKSDWDSANASKYGSFADFKAAHPSLTSPWGMRPGLEGAAQARLERACDKMNEVTFLLYKNNLLGSAQEIAAALQKITQSSKAEIEKRFGQCDGIDSTGNLMIPTSVLNQQRLFAPLLSAGARVALESNIKGLIDDLDLSQDDLVKNNILADAEGKSAVPVNPALAGISIHLVQSASRSQVTRFSEGKFGHRLLGHLFGKKLPEDSLAAQANLFQGLLNEFSVQYMFNGSISFQDDAKYAAEIRSTAAKLIEQQKDFVKKMYTYERPLESHFALLGAV